MKKRDIIIIAATILLALAATGYFQITGDSSINRYLFPRNWGVIEEGKIYRSGLISERLMKKTLQDHGIKVIVTMNAFDPDDPLQVEEKKVVEELGLELYRFPMSGDGTPKYSPLEEGRKRYAGAVAAIVNAKRQGKPVLVHCSAGTHRTGGVTAVYRMFVEGKSPQEAYDELVAYGWNPIKHQALLDYLNPNMAAIAAEMKAMGAIDKIPEPIPQLQGNGSISWIFDAYKQEIGITVTWIIAAAIVLTILIRHRRRTKTTAQPQAPTPQ